MRKLHVVNYTFKVKGESEILQESRLVTIDTQPNENIESQKESSVKILVEWFKSEDGYRNCELQTAVCLPTLTPKRKAGTMLQELIHEGKQYPAFRSSKEVPYHLEGNDYSIDVLIDVYGDRKKFVTGWYDFEEEVWLCDSTTVILKTDKLEWAYLPL